MSTACDGVLYVGKAKSLRRRLASYRSGIAERFSRKLTRLLLRVERIDWDECLEIREKQPPSLTFDEQWRAMDAECLAEFYERLHRRKASS